MLKKTLRSEDWDQFVIEEICHIPYFENFWTDTCRCLPHLRTNWIQLPPYVYVLYNGSKVSYHGIFYEILRDMISYSCLNCSSHGKTQLYFDRNGLGTSSIQPSIQSLMNHMDHKTELTFPVYGKMEDTSFKDYAYIPLVEVRCMISTSGVLNTMHDKTHTI